MTLFDLPDDDRPKRQKRRWIPRCDDCGRRIWSPAAIHRRFGLLLGDTCYRRRSRASRRLTLRIQVRDPGHIPGQGDLINPDDQEEQP